MNWPSLTVLLRELTRMDGSGYDFIAMLPGKFLSEYNVPLAD
jgi:hypothetical protein